MFAPMRRKQEAKREAPAEAELAKAASDVIPSTAKKEATQMKLEAHAAHANCPLFHLLVATKFSAKFSRLSNSLSDVQRARHASGAVGLWKL